MADFEKLLRASLTGVNDSFDTALQEFEKVVEQLSDSVQKTTGRSIRVALELRAENVDGTIYSLTVRNATTGVRVHYYRIAPTGYPIEFGEFDEDRDKFRSRGRLATRIDVESHFAKLLTNRDSDLVLTIAYIMRKADG
jgi:hypothetical protein